jgi:integrase
MRIAAVMDAAKAKHLFVGDNPADWKGGLKELLPARSKLSRGHHAALDYKAMPETMKALRASSGTAARAVEFAALTAGRSGEIRGAVFAEFDMGAALWIIPKERMKAGVEHRVPLSARAVEILTERQSMATGALVFEGGKEGQSISDTAMVKALRLASKTEDTLHGLRSTFRDWAGDETAYPRDVAEAALAHAVGNATEAAYRRSDALEKRRALMNDWADYCRQDEKQLVDGADEDFR